jgi:hypothetical protein
MLGSMKHAGLGALGRLEPLIVSLRNVPELREKSRGVFYRRSRAFLHFHEDPSGLYADVRLHVDEDFVRMPVNTRAEWTRLLQAISADR